VSVSVTLKQFGTGPLPHPASLGYYRWGGRVGERAGAELFQCN